MTIEELLKKLRNILPHTMQVEKDFYDDTIVIRTNLVESEDGDLMSEDGELLEAETMTTTKYLFEVTGGFDIDDRLQPIFDAAGNICGFTLPDGRVADLAICIRVEGGKKEEWITSERKMEELGFESLDYEKSDFTLGDDVCSQEK